MQGGKQKIQAAAETPFDDGVSGMGAVDLQEAVDMIVTTDSLTQYLNEARHDALASDNPHSVTISQGITAESLDFTAADLTTLTDGSNADALHTHAPSGTDLKIQINGSTVDLAVEILDFSTQFTLAESPDHDIDISLNLGNINHNALQNLTVGDVHTHYALLAGRSGGQTLIGGSDSGDDLNLVSTSDDTKGLISLHSFVWDEASLVLNIDTTAGSTVSRNQSGKLWVSSVLTANGQSINTFGTQVANITNALHFRQNSNNSWLEWSGGGGTHINGGTMRLYGLDHGVGGHQGDVLFQTCSGVAASADGASRIQLDMKNTNSRVEFLDNGTRVLFIDKSGAINFDDGDFNGALNTTTLTADRTYTLPDASGTIALLGTIDHGDNVVGLEDDDHTQYLLADGTRNLTGNMLVTSTNELQFRDSDLNISSKTDGHLDYDADIVHDFNTGNLKVTSGQMWSEIQTTKTPTGTTQTINFNEGNHAVVDLGSSTGNVTFTLSNPKNGGSYTIKIIQHDTLSRNVVWPSEVKWENGTILLVNGAPNAVDMVYLDYDGTNFQTYFKHAFS